MSAFKKLLSYLLLSALALFLIAPFVWMLLISLHPPKTPIPPLTEIIPQNATWSNYTFVLFHPNGEPIRALVELELAQAEQASTASSGPSNAAGNPHTRAVGGLRSHRVRDGDSLHSIAYETYGDPFLWRVIAEANGVDDPLRLRRGTDLTIPVLDR